MCYSCFSGCKNWTSNVVGELSQWIDLNNTISTHIRSSSEFAFREELAWASHLSLQAVLCPFPRIGSSGNYARCILQSLPSSPYLQYWVRIPLVKPDISSYVSNDESDQRAPESISQSFCRDGWHCWNDLRTQVGHSHRLSVALELSDDIESVLLPCSKRTSDSIDGIDMRWIQRWSAEPVKALIIPVSLFLTNHKGYPVLSKVMQFVVSIFFRFKMHIVFSGSPKHASPDCEPSYVLYTQYIQFLHAKVRDTMTPSELSFAPYCDVLQSPLQVRYFHML